MHDFNLSPVPLDARSILASADCVVSPELLCELAGLVRGGTDCLARFHQIRDRPPADRDWQHELDVCLCALLRSEAASDWQLPILEMLMSMYERLVFALAQRARCSANEQDTLLG